MPFTSAAKAVEPFAPWLEDRELPELVERAACGDGPTVMGPLSAIAIFASHERLIA